MFEVFFLHLTSIILKYWKVKKKKNNKTVKWHFPFFPLLKSQFMVLIMGQILMAIQSWRIKNFNHSPEQTVLYIFLIGFQLDKMKKKKMKFNFFFSFLFKIRHWWKQWWKRAGFLFVFWQICFNHIYQRRKKIDNEENS